MHKLLKEIYSLEKQIKACKFSSDERKLRIKQFNLLKQWKVLKVKVVAVEEGVNDNQVKVFRL